MSSSTVTSSIDIDATSSLTIVPVPVSVALVTVPESTVADNVNVSSNSTRDSATVSIRTSSEVVDAGKVISVPLVAATHAVPSKYSKFVFSKSVTTVAVPLLAVKSNVMSSWDAKSNETVNTSGLPSTIDASPIVTVGGGVLSVIVVVTLLLAPNEIVSPVVLAGFERLIV